ncbi:hypothetical protein ZHAS_00016230 [Anopheles sinensis]|uniref:Uncharacterized protein n=1 Tax=Anopheles sinensis TaxID=74873 RepID=A0A084WD70_ANOSI|nr:hypothetical protein ZHAS_00016230 [Anopheles sinensis]
MVVIRTPPEGQTQQTYVGTENRTLLADYFPDFIHENPNQRPATSWTTCMERSLRSGDRWKSWLPLVPETRFVPERRWGRCCIWWFEVRGPICVRDRQTQTDGDETDSAGKVRGAGLKCLGAISLGWKWEIQREIDRESAHRTSYNNNVFGFRIFV